jgi:hypothetical protein
MFEFAMNRIVFHLISEIVRIGGDIDSSDDVNLFTEQALIADSLENKATDSSKSVDTNLNCHKILHFLS